MNASSLGTILARFVFAEEGQPHLPSITHIKITSVQILLSLYKPNSLEKDYDFYSFTIFPPFIIVCGIPPYQDLICLLVSVLMGPQHAPETNILAPRLKFD